MRSEMRKLTSVAAVLDSTYRNTRVSSCNAIDEDAAGVQVACELAGQVDILGPEVAAQSKLACICSFDSRVDVGNATDRCNRTKGFFIEGRHPLLYAAQDSRFVESPFTPGCFTPTQHACTFCDASFHLFV